MLQTGDTLAGYRVEAVAGVGGMGVVYRATQMSLDRPVALKVLSSTLVGNRSFRERFRREGRHAAALDHPNIIPVYEAGESNGLMFIAMRLVDGPSLADLIASNGVSGRESLRIVGAIASALDAAHEADLVHRDIKPQNILLTKTGHPYLADFGITKGTSHSGLTHNGDFVGSLNYVAPEQIRGVDVTGASDIYSLTAVLFQCLSGTYPYQRDADAALMHAHLEAPPPTLRDRGIDAPPALDEAFQTGMAKLPARRYPTATALVDACRSSLSAVDTAVLDRAPAFAAPGADEGESEPQAEARSIMQADGLQSSARVLEVCGPAGAAGATGLTAADFHRDPVSTAQPAAARDRRATRATLALISAGLLVAVAPVLGYALGHDDPAPVPAPVRSAAVTLEHGPAWSLSRGGVDGLELNQAVTLRRADGIMLVAGRLPSFEAGFDPVPEALRKRFAAKSAPIPIRLGPRSAVRHAVALRTGERLWLALLPDAKGWVAVACEGPGADRATACPAAASGLDVVGAAAVALGPDKQVAKQINDVLVELNDARRAAESGLRARSLRERERVALRAAHAHARAAAALRALILRPQERPIVARLASALRAQAGRLERLANASGRRRVKRYDAARAAIRRGSAREQQALDRMRSIGYDAR